MWRPWSRLRQSYGEGDRMSNIERGPERIDVGVARADGTYWLWRDIIEPTKPVFEKVEYVRADIHQGAVEALQSIYDRHHMAGDGSAGQVAGDALRALGIDPDRGQ
jgi:hypothetical protein